MDLTGITVNGVSLKVVVDQQDRDEKLEFRQQEIQIMGKTIRAHIGTKRSGNHSGARSGRCRILVQNGQPVMALAAANGRI